jgi:WhiB family redox-sensing transcriptional regulator
MSRPGWHEQAACLPGSTFWGRPVDPEWWFPRSEHGTQLGKRVCETCPVISQCLGDALRIEVSGIWGGTDEIERYGHLVTHKPRAVRRRTA